MKDLLLKFLRAAARALVPPGLVLAAGWYCLQRAGDDFRSPLFWLGLAGVVYGIYGLFLAVGQVKRLEAARVKEATGLDFKRGLWMVAVDYLEMAGPYEGREVELQNSGGGTRNGVSDEVVVLVKAVADPGFRLAVYPAGIMNRPFGFFPPRLPLTSGGEELIFRGAPTPAARPAAERLLSQVSELHSHQFRLLRFSGGRLRLEFRKTDSFYDPREMRRCLNVAVRAAKALGV